MTRDSTKNILLHSFTYWQNHYQVDRKQFTEIASKDRSSRSQMFCKEGVLKNFVKSTGKQLVWESFLNKVAGFQRSSKMYFYNVFWLLSFHVCAGIGQNYTPSNLVLSKVYFPLKVFANYVTERKAALNQITGSSKYIQNVSKQR